MEPIQAIILGAIQGLTEFFPVSSSGHLVIFQQMMGLKEPDLLFDTSVHMGTLAAILIYFFKDIIRIVNALVRSVSGRLSGRNDWHFTAIENRDVNMAWMIVAGSLPTAVIGFGLQQISDVLFSSLLLVGISLLITGSVLVGTRWKNQEKETGSDLSLKQALLIGMIQGVAVIPGISRSGATISAALFLGVNHDTAVRYSFLLSIPAIVGALMLQILGDASGMGASEASAGVIFTGLLASFIVGYAALSMLVKMVQRGRLYFFAPYCLILGAAVLVAGW